MEKINKKLGTEKLDLFLFGKIQRFCPSCGSDVFFDNNQYTCKKCSLSFAKPKEMTHPTVFHMIDVAYVAKAIWDKFSQLEKEFLAKNLNLTVEEAEIFIPCFNALHDIGKITPAFVNRLRIDGYNKKLEKEGYSTTDYEKPFHNESTYHILKRICPESERLWIYHGGHHGFFLISQNTVKPRRRSERKLLDDGIGNEKWQRQQKEIYNTIVEKFGAEEVMAKAKFSSESIAHLFMGIMSSADWLASDPNNFPYTCTVEDVSVDLDAYYKESESRAKSVVEKSFGEYNEFVEKSFEELFKRFSPNSSQKIIIDNMQDIKEPSLIMLRDSTGNGKTEAMLYAANKLASVCGHRSIKYLMPTQATSDSMWSRFGDFVNNFAPNDVMDLQLVHSGSRFSNVHLDDDIQDKLLTSNFMRRTKCRLMSQYTIGTIDQALLGFISVRYFYMRIFALFNSVIIIDEVHSYDIFTSHIVRSLLRHAKELRCSVIMSTATLSTKLCDELIEAYSGSKCSSPYPGAIIVSENYRKSFALPSLRERRIKTEVLYEPDVVNVVKNTWTRLGKDGKGCLICNTVAHSVDAYNIAKKLGYNVILIHGKFSRKIKSRLIQKITELFGKDSKQQKILCIGTQIIEQSLDIDFDYMATYLCPIDFLLQRIGRLHRHFRIRPIGLKEPTVTVYLAKDPAIGEFADTAIYRKHFLEKTLVILNNINNIDLPSDVQKHVDEVYDSVSSSDSYKKRKKIEREKERKSSHNLVDNAVSNGVRVGFLSSSNPIFPSTRDISSSITVVPCTYIDENKIVFIDGTEAEIDAVEAIFEESVTIMNRPNVAAYFKAIDFDPWKYDATLRHMKPLVLENNIKRLKSGVTIFYDEECGLKIDF